MLFFIYIYIFIVARNNSNHRASMFNQVYKSWLMRAGTLAQVISSMLPLVSDASQTLVVYC